MTQMKAWDELEIHDFFAKLEAYKSHINKKRPPVNESDLYTKK
jgi:hypothetical protein